MFFYTVLCIVLQTSLCQSGRTDNIAATTTVAPKMDRNIYKKTAELLHTINSIYNDNDYGTKDQNIKGVEMDYFSMRHNKGTTLKQLLRLIQKNYDAGKQHEDQPKVRLHYISNPEVLEQFKDIIKQKDTSNSYEGYMNSDQNSKIKEILKNLRRQAVFRIDDPASEEKVVLETHSNAEPIQQSAEEHTEKPDKQDNYEAIGDNRKKETESKEKIDNNAWDVITKKYDNWDEKDNWDAKDKKDWGGKETNISEDDKKKQAGKKGDKWDDWGLNKDKKDNKWDDIGQDKQKDNWDGWGQQKVKKENKRDDFGRDKKKDNWDDWGQKKDKKDNKWDNVGQDDWGKKKEKKRKIEKIDEWGLNNDKKDNKWDEVAQKRKEDSWDDWGQKKKDTIDTWGEQKAKPKKERIDIKWEEQNNRKDTDLKKKNSDWDNKWDKKSDNWDNWEVTTKQQRKGTTKRKVKVTVKKINEWDHYVPKLQNKPKRHEYERNGPAGAFGRTSIPFVGKKGIYEDK